MELKNEFRVGVPIEQAWDTLTDVESVSYTHLTLPTILLV